LSLWAEIKRRKVMKVAIAYAITSWLLAQITVTIKSPLQLPNWTDTLVIVLLGIGFPLALVLSWAYDLTPEGIRRTPDSTENLSPPLPDSALASTVVFPFKSLTPDSPYNFLAEAIPLELQNFLLRVPNVRVVSGQSASAHGSSGKDLPSIAKTINVQYAISGSIAAIGDKLRITATLNDAANDAVLWSENYDAHVDDVLSVQQQIATSVVSAFGGERLRIDVARASHAESADMAAWQLVQKAKAYLLDYSAETVNEAIPLITAALKLDPGYAEGHAALALVTAEKTLNGISDDPIADRQSALAAARHALELAPQDPVVLRAVGPTYAYVGLYRQAIELLETAVAVAPFDLGAWGYFGWPLVASGSTDDLEKLHGILDRLLTTAANHPGKTYWLFHKSVAYACEKDWANGLKYAEQVRSLQPRFSLGWMNYANLLGQADRLNDARSAVEHCKAVNSKMTPEYYRELMAALTDNAVVVQRRTKGLIAAELLAAS